MALDLGRRESALSEWMDRPDCDLPTLRRTYARFRTVNALVAGWQLVYRRELRPALVAHARSGAGTPLTLLDIGCGGGDVPLQLAAWARRDGLQLRVTAIDADARAIEYARQVQAPGRADVQFRQVLSADLIAEGRSFDFVTSNHLLHHLTAPELAALLDDSERLCRDRALHGDIGRSSLAYAAFSVLSLFFPGTFIRDDGLTSIRRSHTRPELAALAPPGWTVENPLPFRNLLTFRAPLRG